MAPKTAEEWRAYYARHRDTRLAASRAYHARNREKERAYAAAHRAAHLEECRAYGRVRSRAYRARHREESRAYAAAHRAAHVYLQGDMVRIDSLPPELHDLARTIKAARAAIRQHSKERRSA